MEDIKSFLKSSLDGLLNEQYQNNKLQLQEILAINNNLYTQIESLLWLQKRLGIKGHLPSLRGWPVSPDFLLKLHHWIMKNRPRIVVEMGSGASTLVIADALRQNKFGKLISFEHLQKYANITLSALEDEYLLPWVDLRVVELVLWEREHLNPIGAVKKSMWYPVSQLYGIEGIDLLIVDGPPEGTCGFARYPALPAVFDYLSENAEVWMDDANRKQEKEICKVWSDKYGFKLEYIALEKGLIVLT